MENQKNHNFFKHGPANAFFKESIKGIQNGAPLSLSIFFNKHGDWIVKNYDIDKSAINNGKAKLQIKTFFEAAKDQNTVFWLFDDLIYALIPQLVVNNGTITNAIKEAKYGQPKTVNVTVFSKFEKKSLPEAFASINSYQKYNRKTIVKLEEPEKEIAEWVWIEGCLRNCVTITFINSDPSVFLCPSSRFPYGESIDYNIINFINPDPAACLSAFNDGFFLVFPKN